MNRTQDRLLNRKHSTTELQQPAGKQTLQFCIYTVKGYCYATVSPSTNQWKKIFEKKNFHWSVESETIAVSLNSI